MVEPLEASKEDLLVVGSNNQRASFARFIALLVLPDPFFVCSMALINQVHTQSYLNSLKTSFRVATIMEVLIAQRKLNWPY